MDRFFSVLLLSGALLLTGVPAMMRGEAANAQPVFFSMLFPQLTPEPESDWFWDMLLRGRAAEEAVHL